MKSIKLRDVVGVFMALRGLQHAGSRESEVRALTVLPSASPFLGNDAPSHHTGVQEGAAFHREGGVRGAPSV